MSDLKHRTPDELREIIRKLEAVQGLVEALRDIAHSGRLDSYGDPLVLRAHARTALAAWDATTPGSEQLGRKSIWLKRNLTDPTSTVKFVK